jgi:hypothetical protein
MNVTKQCQTVYDYLNAHPGSTILDIINGTCLPYAADRIRELRRGGVPIIVVGRTKEMEGRSQNILAIRQASRDTLPTPGLLSPGEPQRS